MNGKEARLAELEHAPAPAINIPDNPFVDSSPFIPVPDTEDNTLDIPSRFYPETNWENYEEVSKASFPPVAKYSLEALAFRMAEPTHFKFLMPRPLELYSLDEVNTALPRHTRKWNNRHEDPSEPAKSWSWEKFSNILSCPGYHFMIGWLAQTQAQQFDRKLPVLEAALSKRWNCHVTLETMAPCHDFMLCSIPSKVD